MIIIIVIMRHHGDSPLVERARDPTYDAQMSSRTIHDDILGRTHRSRGRRRNVDTRPGS